MSSPTISQRIARWRVPLGFALGALALALANPSWPSLQLGALIAAVGESIRVWAAGHLEKSREVTQSGPYAFVRHPLYLGTSIIGLGVAVAGSSLAVALIVLAYIGTTIPAAMKAEEAHLRDKFGAAYDDYLQREAPPMPRRFSLSRALGNREHHTIAGLLAALALLAIKVQLSLP